MAEILRVDFHSGEVFNKPARGAAKREHPSSKAGQCGLPKTNAGRTRPFDFEKDGCGAEAVGGRVVSLGLEDDGHTTYAPDYLDENQRVGCHIRMQLVTTCLHGRRALKLKFKLSLSSINITLHLI
jgi:hypothetical protein